ncbi:hypothetical protein C449_13907 [Halococcus saccharolyticus DSM 5350]|uniref:Uncharacterized protein n=1 Tax=Halococcus saccharolyticus DSM 5350 TaxID=1227455 RepID=M0MD43_9EURY|nr:hypothetical protein C449_13907 [Halococcus saccharolyticus DSM 5350]
MFTLVPFFKEFLTRSTSSQSRMDFSLIADIRDVSRRDSITVKVPDRLRCVGEMVGEESTAVLLGEGSSKAEFRSFVERSHVEKLDFQQVAGFGTVYVDRSSQIMYLCEVNVTDFIRVIIILNLSASPVKRLETHGLAWIRLDNRRNVRMPPIEWIGSGLFVGRFVHVDFERYFGHCYPWTMTSA